MRAASCLYFVLLSICIAVTCHTGKKEIPLSDDFVSSTLPYRRWFWTDLVGAMVNVGIAVFNLWLLWIDNEDPSLWAALIVCVCGVNLGCSVYLVKTGLRYLRKARLQEAGLVTYPRRGDYNDYYHKTVV